MTELLQPELVLETLAKAFRVEKNEFRQRRRKAYLRAVAARFLIRYAGQTEREVAEFLGMRSGSAVSKQLGRLSGKLMTERSIIRPIKQAEKLLDKKRAAAII